MKAYFQNKKEIEIRKIFCLGLNYQEHILEMAHQKPSQPVIFIKPDTAICYNNAQIDFPKISDNLHYEAELIVILNKNGKHIDSKDALSYVGGYAIGLDLTLRDLQKIAKENGLPWLVSKGFDQSAPISDFIEYHADIDFNTMYFELKVNNETKQIGQTKNMIFKIEEIISYLSDIFTLEKGDIIFTGTPSGVGQIVSGDHVEAVLNHSLSVCIDIK